MFARSLANDAIQCSLYIVMHLVSVKFNIPWYRDIGDSLNVNVILPYSDISKEISVDAAKTVKDIDEEKRKRLRELEVKVAKYADKLESSGKESQNSVKEKVEQYRQQLLEVMSRF